MWICVLASLFLPDSLRAQNSDSLRVQFEHDLERMAEPVARAETDISTEHSINMLEELALNPLNINRATLSELAEIPSLNLRLAGNIIRYRTEIRPYEELSDLTNVEGIGNVTLNRIKPYITMGSSTEQSQDLLFNRRYWTADSRFEFFSRFRQDLQKRDGYRRPVDEGGYRGSPLSYYQRMRYRSDHLSLNLTQSKDAGESLQLPAGFDYTSWHFHASDAGRLQSLVIGDYSLQFGQGLILWQSSSFGKGVYQFNSGVKNESGVRPYTSSQETRFFRGAAMTYGQSLQMTLFLSSRKLTASSVTADSIRFPTDSGYHRTATEFDRRFNTIQKTAGSRLRLKLPSGYIGATGYWSKFNRPIAGGSQPWQQYDFQGTMASALSVDFRFVAGQSILFGELGRSYNGVHGMVTGTEIESESGTKLSLLYRNYPRRFHSIFGSGFGENSGNPQNESGIYVAAEQPISEKLTVRGYLDVYRFPAPDYLMHNPSHGHEWAFKSDYDVSNVLNVYLQIRNETSGDEFVQEDLFGEKNRVKSEKKLLKLRLHSEWFVLPDLRIRNRVEWVRNRPAGESATNGMLAYHDMRYRPADGLSIDTRFTWFRTDGYGARVYSFENDLLYVFTNRALFDHGIQLYLLTSWALSPSLEFWLKGSLTHYFNKETIGSGRSEIKNNQISRVSFQIRLRL